MAALRFTYVLNHVIESVVEPHDFLPIPAVCVVSSSGTIVVAGSYPDQGKPLDRRTGLEELQKYRQ